MKRWAKYIKPYILYFIFGPICMIVEVIGEVLIPKLLSVVINNANADTLTVGSSLEIMILMIVVAAIMMCGGIGGAYFGAKASVNFAADLRADIYKKIQNFSFANIDRFSTGSLVTRLTNDVTQLQNFVNMLLRMALRAPGMMIAALIMAVIIKPLLSVIFAVVIPLMLIIVGFIISKGFPLFSKMQKKVDALNSTVQENVTNVRVVKSFVREEFEYKKFKTINRNLKLSSLSAMKIMIFIQPVLTVFMNLTTLAVVWFGGKIVLNNGMQIGDLSAFITYVTQILSSLMMITMLLMFSSRALASSRRITEILDAKSDITDDEATYTDLKVKEGNIEFKNVSFKYYKNSQENVLNDINLSVKAGTTVGIIGSTGCGKSTLVAMIARLYDADKGSVLIDGVDVKDYKLENLRDGIGFVLQKNTLFSGTIAENLRWGDYDAGNEELENVVQNAQAAKFIKEFPGGFEYVLEQGGANLSGGQKQRLCIARALLKKPKILILDDSTSAIDMVTETKIRKIFNHELAGSTKIIIAQRITSVKEADTIVVMDDGKITGVGTHSKLLKCNVEYQEIYYSQNESKGGADSGKKS